MHITLQISSMHTSMRSHDSFVSALVSLHVLSCNRSKIVLNEGNITCPQVASDVVEGDRRQPLLGSICKNHAIGNQPQGWNNWVGVHRVDRRHHWKLGIIPMRLAHPTPDGQFVYTHMNFTYDMPKTLSVNASIYCLHSIVQFDTSKHFTKVA